MAGYNLVVPTTFNELLIDAGLDPAEVRLVRHHTKPGLRDKSLHDLWLRDRAAFELYQRTQSPKRKLFRTGPVWAAFTSPAAGRTLFVGLYGARYVERAVVDWTCPYRGEAPGRSEPVDVFETRLRPEMQDQIGRLEIEWDPASIRTWARYADEADMPVVGTTVTNPKIAASTPMGLVKALLELGFTERHRTQKVVGYARSGLSVYVKAHTVRQPLVLHPRYFDLADRLEAIPGVEFERPLRPYINSNMRSLPLYEADGRDTTSRFGFAISAKPGSIPALLDTLLGARTIETTYGEIRLVGDDEEPLTETERLASARIGQGDFRYALLALWGGACPILGIDHPALLRASHIKPWRSATGRERLDPFNGLLLTTNIDALFDAGLISFTDDGSMLVSHALGEQNLGRMGISREAKLHGLSERHSPYLAHHRAEVFLGSAVERRMPAAPERRC